MRQGLIRKEEVCFKDVFGHLFWDDVCVCEVAVVFLLFNGLVFVADDELGATAGDPLARVLSKTSRVREGDTPVFWLLWLLLYLLLLVVVWLL